MNYQLHHGDCLEVLKTIADNSVDSIVTDPPYGLSFMGKKWDYDVPSVEVWEECLRVLKPGGHLLAFAGTRTQHRMAVRIEDAGFEIRDMIAWVYGSGFPKSLDVSKAIDKAAGVEREVVGSRVADDIRGGNMHAANRGERHVIDITAPATPEAQQWVGWGTALKPALEPITVARKPFAGTVAANVLAHGTGAINVDGCRIAGEPWTRDNTGGAAEMYDGWGMKPNVKANESGGRWPANLIHDGSDEVVGLFPVTTSGTFPATQNTASWKMSSKGSGLSPARAMGDSGSAARFFYCAKASKKDRDEGCEGMEVVRVKMNNGNDADGDPVSDRFTKMARNHHPTVKPTDLMRYLCRLVTQPGGVVLDPFMGSGSTGKAAMLEGFEFIGIERDAEYLQIAKARIEREPVQKQLL
jgi:site-specific DNA-methyltransferase (adenine-specific)